MEEIADLISKRESIQLVGVSGLGSSLVVKALSQNVAIQKKHFSAKKYAFLRLDGTMLLERNTLNLSRIFLTTLNSSEIPNDPIAVYNRIEDEITTLCRDNFLVLIIDHLRELDFENLKPFFLNLYQLYRRFEPKISFIFVTAAPLTSSSDLANFDMLGQLMLQNIIFTPIFNKSDAFWFIDEKLNQIHFKLGISEREKIFKLSGGFPRTIKRLVESVGRGYKLSELELNPSVDSVLAFHLSEMSENRDLPPIPILEIYLRLKNTRQNSEVFGEVITKWLTRNEEKVFQYLLANKGKIVERNNIIEEVWGDGGIGISDHAYDQIIHRLRGKLLTATPKVEIETIRGRGHCLKVEK